MQVEERTAGASSKCGDEGRVAPLTDVDDALKKRFGSRANGHVGARWAMGAKQCPKAAAVGIGVLEAEPAVRTLQLVRGRWDNFTKAGVQGGKPMALAMGGRAPLGAQPRALVSNIDVIPHRYDLGTSWENQADHMCSCLSLLQLTGFGLCLDDGVRPRLFREERRPEGQNPTPLGVGGLNVIATGHVVATGHVRGATYAHNLPKSGSDLPRGP